MKQRDELRPNSGERGHAEIGTEGVLDIQE